MVEEERRIGKDRMKEEANGSASTNEHKVFKVVDTHLRSSLSLPSYSVCYRVGEFIRAPEGTKFFVFDSLEHADDFMRLDPDLRIWRATARGLSPADRRVCHPKERVDIEDFWRVHNSGGSYGVLGGRRVPSGTLWADEVRLDERLQSEESPQQGVNCKWLDAIESFVKRLLGAD
ncbi:MAG TPA: hypothetical protein VIS71_10745 [Terrimicrobium sp.]